MVGLEPTSFVCKTNVLPVILHSHINQKIFMKPIGLEPIQLISKTNALPIKLGLSIITNVLLPHQLPLARPCYDLAPIANKIIFIN